MMLYCMLWWRWSRPWHGVAGGGRGRQIQASPFTSRQEVGTASSPHTHIMRFPTHPKALIPVAEGLLVCLMATTSCHLLECLMSVFTHLVRRLWWPSQELILSSGLRNFYKVCIVTIIFKNKWHREVNVHQCHHPLNQVPAWRVWVKTDQVWHLTWWCKAGTVLVTPLLNTAAAAAHQKGSMFIASVSSPLTGH